jgi:transcriptional regulator with XRE-family HTH domain
MIAKHHWNIRKWRKKFGFSQIQLAEELDITTVTLRAYETNKMVPKAVKEACIAIILRINYEDTYKEIDI